MRKLLIIPLLFICTVLFGQNFYWFGQNIFPENVLGDLISVWEFDETNGGTAFDSFGAHNGTNNGAGVNQSGKLDKAYNLSASDNINFGNHSDFTFATGSGDLPFSISMWINPSVLNGRLLGKFGEWRLHLDHNGIIEFVLSDKDGGGVNIGIRSTLFEIPTSAWTFILCTYDGSNTKEGLIIYINGVESTFVRNETGTYEYMEAKGNDLTISSLGLDYIGLVDQTTIWGKELSPIEVNYLWNSGAGRFYINW